MKKKVIFLVATLAFSTVSWSQITQKDADSIILERMSTEVREHAIYAKMDSLPITTNAGELLTLDYPCWIYYIHYEDQANDSLAPRRYLVVKESSGNVLEVRTKNDAKPDLIGWRKVPEVDTLCHCIMDTLKGTWTWFQTTGGMSGPGIFKSNNFKSVIKILGQNADSSINYEVWVKDTVSFWYTPDDINDIHYYEIFTEDTLLFSRKFYNSEKME